MDGFAGFGGNRRFRIIAIGDTNEDHIGAVSQAEFDRIVGANGLNPNGKETVGLSTHLNLASEFAHINKRVERGGSVPNALITAKLFDPSLEVDLVSVVGGTAHSHKILAELERAEINLRTDLWEKSITPEGPVTHLLLSPNKNLGKAYGTYPGNARSLIKPNAITPDLVANSDMAFVAINAWMRLDHDVPNMLLRHRWDNNIPSAATLPTNFEWSEKNANLTQYIVTSTDLVFTNMDELLVPYRVRTHEQMADQKYLKGHPVTDAERHQAMDGIQQGFRENVLSIYGRAIPGMPQVAFITDEDRDVWVVTANNRFSAPIERVEDELILNKGGAGDTAQGAFLAAWKHRFQQVRMGVDEGWLITYKEAAELAVKAAAEKISTEHGPCLKRTRYAIRDAQMWMARPSEQAPAYV